MNICRVTCIFLIMYTENMQVKGGQFFGALRILKKNSHNSLNMHKARFIAVMHFTFRRYLTDEDGSFWKLSVAITVTFDSISFGIRSSTVCA